MMKMKLVTSILLILVAAGAAPAAEVINVDLNGYNSRTPYVGNGAYDVGDDTVWTVYYGGWGIPVGSARSEGLAESWQNKYCSVYAAQVWLGDNGEDHTYQYGSGLMDDGFVADPCNEPNLAIFGKGAYQGIYDIYVYGNDEGKFKLGYYGTVTEANVTGGIAAGTFVNGGNYVVFPNVDINDPNSGNIYIAYTNKLNGLQFVKKKSPVSVGNGTRIKAGNWDVAGERNTRGTEPQEFGPDTYTNANDPNDPNNDPNQVVGYLEPLEFMVYDITVDDANKGQYQISLDVNVSYGEVVMKINMFLDDINIGDVSYKKLSPVEGPTTTVTANLFAGSHTIKWVCAPGDGYGYGYNIMKVNFTKIGNAVMNNCADVAKYGLFYDADITATDANQNPNCVVDIYDLDAMISNWLKSQ